MDFKIPDTPEELFRQSRKSFGQFNKGLPFLFVLMILLGFALSSFYTVETDEVGLIQRFGKYVRTTEPGLHWKLPFNIETLIKVPVKKVHKEEFGFRTDRADIRTQYSTKSYNDESLMLTGDLNVLDVTWIVQYRVKDPVQYAFNIRTPATAVRDVSEAVMRQVIGDSSVSEALTLRRIQINLDAQERMQEILDSFKSGIQIDTVKLQDVNPPDQVKPSFNAVNEAKQEKEKVINQSWETYNKVIPKAKGEATKMIQEAEGYSLSRINKAKGDAVKFTDIWTAYKDAREVTKRRLFLESMEQVLPKAGPKYVITPEGSSILPLLNLNREAK